MCPVNFSDSPAPSAPWVEPDGRSLKSADRIWKLTAVLTFFPIAAILHNRVFSTHLCILNLIGDDYTPSVLASWLRSDPSPWLALVASVGAYFLGNWKKAIRAWGAAFVVAFLPLSVWLWDIPFTGRVVCRVLHDGRTWLSSRHFYLLGAIAYFPIGYFLMRRTNKRRSQRGAPAHASESNQGDGADARSADGSRRSLSS
jgi:hypothetical protein